MKKYLMIGFAALAFAGCANHDFEPMTQQEIVKAEYDAKFVADFGQPASNHTWGFGSTTRAFTRGVFANGNEWAANDKEGCMYRVPPKLNADQTAVVIKYFQTHKDLGYENPKWTNYFIQQVYKGGDAPLAGYSPEQYEAANGTDNIVGSDKMNHLAAIDPDMEDPVTGEKPFVDHNNNFNHGDCGEGYPDVLDFEGTLTTVVATYSANSGMDHRHSDKINLMTNSTTKSFGYFNSDGSVRRTEYTGLVSYKTIMKEMGAEADCLDDGWNRSFMGFDFEMMVGDEIYAKNDDGSIKYLKYGDLPDAQYAWDGTSTYGEARPADDEFVMYKGNKVPLLIEKRNEYAGKDGSFDQNLLIVSHSCLSGYQEINGEQVPYYQNQNCLNVGKLYEMLDAGYTPVNSGIGYTWVKVGGTADGYFSDWIVTLTEATKYDTPDEPVTYEGRIMAEDLTVADKSDWDFNDVVFDWTIKDGKAYINLLAAGGTLPIRVGGHRDDNTSEPIGSIEIHSADALGGYMVNTGVNVGKTSAAFVLTDHTYADHDGDDILITVYKGGEWVEIEAEEGEPAGKFNAPVDTDWCEEYANIKKVYTEFAAWVKNEAVEWAVNPIAKYVDYRNVEENRKEAAE